MAAVVEVPPFFLCPISLEIMKDPVTVPTGITYDRESIEKWLFCQKKSVCPVTKQDITNSDLTPNITLRRYIQAWCTVNASHDGAIERFPTPKAPISKPQIVKILNECAHQSPQMQIKSLNRLRSIASQNETNRRCMEMVGTADFLASILINNEKSNLGEDDTAREALSLLSQLHISDSSLKSLFETNAELIESLVSTMQLGAYESRAYAVMLLKSMSDVVDPKKLVNVGSSFFTESVQVLKDQISQKASKSALKLLINVCPGGRNRMKAVEAGLVTVLVDLLVDSSEKRSAEMIMVLLEILSQCAEGRAEILAHSAGIAVVSKKILRVSQVVSERAVKILYSISRFSATSFVLQEMLSLGVVAKLCLVLQVECGSKTKERARDVLKMHARVWKNSPCIPNSLLSSYP